MVFLNISLIKADFCSLNLKHFNRFSKSKLPKSIILKKSWSDTKENKFKVSFMNYLINLNHFWDLFDISKWICCSNLEFLGKISIFFYFSLYQLLKIIGSIKNFQKCKFNYLKMSTKLFECAILWIFPKSHKSLTLLKAYLRSCQARVFDTLPIH